MVYSFCIYYNNAAKFTLQINLIQSFIVVDATFREKIAVGLNGL